MAWTTEPKLLPGIAVFYGVRPAWAHLWQQARREARDWYFLDNAYFDDTRDHEYRVTKNAIQHNGAGQTNGKRFEALGIRINPPHKNGGVVVACAQSAEFMQIVANDPDWLSQQVYDQRSAGHQVLVRYKGEKRPLAADLAHARLLITWSSAASVCALLAGVPVVCAPQCCAYRVGMQDRERWAGVLADNQWTLGEMARGKTWKALNAHAPE